MILKTLKMLLIHFPAQN